MTTITFAVSRALGATMAPGDEIVVTRTDHDANVAPWLAVAEAHDRGVCTPFDPAAAFGRGRSGLAGPGGAAIRQKEPRTR